MSPLNIALRLGIGVSTAVGGGVHAYLYAHGYREIPTVGSAFLIQASVMCALAVLILLGGPAWLNLAAAAVAAGSIVAFALSRTVGLFGFVETGWDPRPYALLSVVVEGVAVALVAASVLLHRRSRSSGADEFRGRRVSDSV